MQNKIIFQTLGLIGLMLLTCAWRWNPADRAGVKAAADAVTTAQAAADAAQTTADWASNQVAVLNTSVWGSASITTAVDATTNTVTIQARDITGGDLAAYRVLHIWVSDSDLGAATTNGVETLTLSGGTAVATVTANADYWYVTSSAGAAAAEVVGSAAGTNWIMVADGSTVSSAEVVFESAE